MKRITSLLLALAMAVSAALLSACSVLDGITQGYGAAEGGGTTEIVLSDGGVTVDGRTASTDAGDAVYTDNDIVFYPEGQGFTYGEGTAADAHNQAEADAHTVVHITRPGVYSVSGTLSAGQIAVDLGEDAAEDPEAVVTLILNGVDVTCTVAPAVIFYSVYECGSADAETASRDVDTSDAGANVVIADGTTNHVAGSYVARIYRPESVELTEDGSAVASAKKLHKYDGAFYSKMSMNVDGGEQGTGVLNIDAENEGLDSELHLTVNGGNINIVSGNDGVNTNEDNVSVMAVNGGTLTIRVTGETGEGDGIDSNGWLVINGGTVIAASCADSADSGLDADLGVYINGGTVVASGNMNERIEDGGQNYAMFSFASVQSGGTSCMLKDAGGQTVGAWTPANDYTCLVISTPTLEAGTYTLWQGQTQMAAAIGMAGGMVPPGEFGPPEGGEPPKDFAPPEDGESPEGFEPPEDGGPFGGDGGPDRMDGPDGTDGGDGGWTAEFTITDGGSLFGGIVPLDSAETGET